MQTKGLEKIRLGKRLLFGSLRWRRYVAVRLFFTSRPSSKTHYEVLGLKKNCTQGEIKESYIRLSKEMHPDKNPEHPETHSKFVLINEAYSVLSKPSERRLYDSDLSYQEQASRMYNYNGVATNAPRGNVYTNHYGLWENRDRSQDKNYEERPYYGIKGVKRLPNYVVAMGAIAFMFVGGCLHFFIALKASQAASEQLNERDRITSLQYKAVRQQALANGYAAQNAIMRERLENGNQGN